MSQDRDRVVRGDTVYIDSSALSELSPQLMQQDLETLVGLNIHSSDLETLHVTSDGHVVDSSGVILSDGVSVGNIVEISDEQTAMDTSDSLSDSQPMEVDTLTDSGHVLNEMNLLQHGHDFIPISSRDDLIDDASSDGQTTKPAFGSPGVAIKQEVSTLVTDSSLSTQILKNNSGQFVILQPDQGSLPVTSLNNKLFSSANIILSSLASTGTKITKPNYVNSNQISGTTVRQIENLYQAQPQFRTLQLNKPISLSSDNQSSGVTKVILTSQPGNNLSQQLRLITSQANNQSQQNNQTNASNSSKLSFQFQPFGLSLSSTKNVIQSPSKLQINDNDKLTTKIKIPFTIPIKGSSSSIPQLTTLQSNDISNQTITQNESKVSPTLTTPQNLIIKGNIPLSGNASNFKPGQILATSGTHLIKIPMSQLSQLSNQNQTVQLANKMNIRLVTSSNSTVTTSPANTIQISGNQLFKSFNVASSKPIAPANNKNAKTNKTIPIQINQSPKPQRLIIPVSSTGNQDNNSSSITSNLSGIQIRPQGSITLPASALPPGVLSNAQPGSLVMIPAQYFQNATGLSNHIIQTSNQNSTTTTVASSQQPKAAPNKTVIDANIIKPRKPCNCTKSQCLKLYCDCFANGEFCNNCNCVNCYNNLTHEEERQKAIKCCLERNPHAFRPKIGKGGSDSERRHNKGCNCKRSGCLKNYCECYEAKIPCSNMCKCIGCRNMDSCQPYERKRLMQLAEAAEARVNQHIAIKNRPLTFSSLPSPAKMSLSLSAKNTYCRISQEVVEATCHCLLAQAELIEKSKVYSQEKLELKVINEFSRCLLQIIGFNSKTKGSGVQ